MPSERSERPQETSEVSKPSPDTTAYDALSKQGHDALEIVKDSFVWFGEAATAHIDEMGSQIRKKDAPSLMEGLIESLVDAALGAGAAAAGERLFLAVERIVGAGAVRHEFVKGLFEEGAKAGIAKGKSALAAETSSEAVDKFLLSQKEGALEVGQASQANFTDTDRYKVATDGDALALRKACVGGAMRQAGEAQAAACRDAWLAYLAQARFGKNASDGATNMMDASERKTNMAWATKSIPTRAPALADTIQGNVPGVLVVKASLPAIDPTHARGDKPEVEYAVINGVNEELRAAYAGQPLSQSHIPRQIVAKVAGDLPGFTLNINEAGHVQGIDERAWLMARGAHVQNEARGETSFMKGVEALLAELHPSHIDKGALE